MFSTGGTGGHIIPAINLMKHFFDQGYKVLLVTDSRGNNFLKNYPINPTFTFVLGIDAFDLEEFMTFLEETLEKFLDGEENLTYYAPIYAGDKIIVYKKLLIS